MTEEEVITKKIEIEKEKLTTENGPLTVVKERKVEKGVKEKQFQLKQKRLREKSEILESNLKDSDDSSDEEVLLRTGNVPKEWYDMYDHKGYDVKGKKVGKPEDKDEVDEFIKRQNDPNWWRQIHDYMNNKDVRLSKGDMQILLRIRQGLSARKEFDPFENPVEYHSEDYIHPYMPTQEPKRKFQPSKWERLKVNKMVKALRKGWMKTTEEREKEEQERREKEERAWDIWEDESIVTWRPRKMPKAI